ncbi:hypothetical protein FA95DRAFT_411645 [Auriscalpium vulgare]|uniref:Uncharacterized protein n=1 Tax=Auriscalpium vulgare TaxID=40419 RepID=A0ACB8RHZ8_9AGAM|nr:hypothetical protein FA95DRAFT_411645 [Auriscalpium vulgare]
MIHHCSQSLWTTAVEDEARDRVQSEVRMARGCKCYSSRVLVALVSPQRRPHPSAPPQLLSQGTALPGCLERRIAPSLPGDTPTDGRPGCLFLASQSRDASHISPLLSQDTFTTEGLWSRHYMQWELRVGREHAQGRLSIRGDRSCGAHFAYSLPLHIT